MESMIVRVALMLLCYVASCQADVCGGNGYEIKMCQNGCCNHQCCPEDEYYNMGYKIGTVLGVLFVIGLVIAGIVIVVCVCRRRKNRVVVYTQLTNPSSAVTVTEAPSNSMMATPQV